MIFPSWREVFLALSAAETCEELWTVLLTPHGIRTSSAWEEPLLLFSRFHRHDPNGAAITALLLCTDTRWRTGSHRLIRKLADSGMLDDTALDDLASSFLEPEIALDAIREPDSGQPASRADASGADASGAVNGEASADAPTIDWVVVRRQVWPPLRRWAAARQVQREPARWRDLLELARSSASSDATAIAVGVMEAVDLIPSAERAEVLEQGMGWGSGTVRLAAFREFARLNEELAKRRARQDPSGTVRTWAKSPPQVRVDPQASPDPHSGAVAETNVGGCQVSLFDTSAPD